LIGDDNEQKCHQRQQQHRDPRVRVVACEGFIPVELVFIIVTFGPIITFHGRLLFLDEAPAKG
jgi:hypothetical protein